MSFAASPCLAARRTEHVAIERFRLSQGAAAPERIGQLKLELSIPGIKIDAAPKCPHLETGLAELPCDCGNRVEMPARQRRTRQTSRATNSR